LRREAEPPVAVSKPGHRPCRQRSFGDLLMDTSEERVTGRRYFGEEKGMIR
jgi:hypothetical protein